MVKINLSFFFIAFLVAGACSAPSLAGAESASSTFVSMCSVCHGSGGKGDGPGATGLQPKPADFTDCKHMGGQSDESLFTIIKRGGTGAGRSAMMPSWGGSLNDEQISELVAYIRSLCKK